MYAYRFPEKLKSIIAMDIGMGPGPAQTPNMSQLLNYQKVNIHAFRTHNTTEEQLNGGASPCGLSGPCRQTITSGWGWPYNQIVNHTWHTGLAPSVPVSRWQFSLVPSLPQIPLLFMWGKCDIGTGSGWGKPCGKRKLLFFGQEWVDWIHSRGLQSQVVPIDGAGHWTQCKVPNATNSVMAKWLSLLD